MTLYEFNGLDEMEQPEALDSLTNSDLLFNYLF